MLTSRFVIFFILLFAFFSCKKDPIQYRFNGTITENVSSAPLAGVDVSIKQLEVSNTVTTSIYSEAGTATTNSLGYYEMSFERKKVSQFQIKLERDGYFKREIEISAGDISSENENELNYQMDAKSWLNFDIQNTGLSDPSDEFVLILYKYRKGCDNCASADYNYFYGIVDTNFRMATTSGGYFKFTYSQIGVNSYTDSLFLIPFDTLNYSIEY